MTEAFFQRLAGELWSIRSEGLYNPERVVVSRQGPRIAARAEDGGILPALNLCANDYLGLAGDRRIAAGAAQAAEAHGAGLASVRFICGTHEIHKRLEAAVAEYLGFEDALLFAAGYDANGAVFEPLFSEQDAIVSDALNHASIIDGARLSKARRYRYAFGDMDDLARQLAAARADGARDLVVVTDGVFSMDGHVARIPEIRALADRYGGLVMVDDCHATGHLGPGGRGSAALCGTPDAVDILTGTFGKTLGGAMGGFVAARREVVALLRQRARPYLFSNALSPAVCGAALAAIDIARSEEGEQRRTQLQANVRRFRAGLAAAGAPALPGETPIVPVMLGDARRAQAIAAALFAEGVFVTGFAFPVVPRGQARIRVQLSAAHAPDDLDRAVEAFERAYRQVGESADG